MISGRNIIAIASNWHFDPTSKHHVMTILSEHNNVLWVNYHGSRRPRVSAADAGHLLGKLAQSSEGPQWVEQNILALTPLVLPFPSWTWARQINQRLLVRQIARVLVRLPQLPVQLWSFAPDVDFLVGQFAEELSLYYCVDEFSQFVGYDGQVVQRAERGLLGKCDVVITTSRLLQESKSPLHPRTHLVPHGVSYDHFAAAAHEHTPVAPAMQGIPAPVFGFFGIIQDWVDVELIAALARRRPEWSFVLVGKVLSDVSACSGLANVHLVGQVPFTQLPGYCKAFDAGLIPFKINPLTLNVNPIKLREYLAAGLPVVSTDLPEVRPYRPHVLIGDGVDSFERACAAALQQRTAWHRELRQTAVRHETWRDKVNELSAIVQGVLDDKSSADRPAPVERGWGLRPPGRSLERKTSLEGESSL